MNKDLTVKNGSLVIQQINFKRLLVRKVIKNDPQCKQGKIALPKNLIGTDVFVVIEDVENE